MMIFLELSDLLDAEAASMLHAVLYWLQRVGLHESCIEYIRRERTCVQRGFHVGRLNLSI